MKNKTTAGILALFLGGIGVHRFYLGQAGLGILHLIFCWTFIPSFVAFIDAIIFFTNSEEVFDAKYNYKYMATTLYHNQKGQQAAASPQIIINNNTAGGNMTQGPAQTSHSTPTANSNANRPPVAKQVPAKSATPKKDPFEKKGDLKYEDYDFDGAIADYLKSLNVRSKNPEVHFKLSCLYSIMEKVDSSFFHLSKAVEQGYFDFEKIKTHDHLAYLRTQQPEFDYFVAAGYKLEGKKKKPTPTLNLSDEVISRIEKLAELRDKGIINDEEFQDQKGRLLG